MESSSQLSVTPIDVAHWRPETLPDPDWQRKLESGRVLYCPVLTFPLHPEERRFLDPAFADPKRKSIYRRADRAGLFGAAASAEDTDALAALVKRFEASSMALLEHLFPAYRGTMQSASTSFRPRPTGAGEKALSWRKDDTRLHVDAFPSNPTQGMRILRVFSNIGAAGRVWRVGEPFEPMARHFLPRIPKPRRYQARWAHALGITKRVRSAYDHYMLYLHDRAKADLAYQRASPQATFAFPPGSSWICFSDQVMHAAMSGQFMLEQTVHLPWQALAYPSESPLAILERLTGQHLLATATD